MASLAASLYQVVFFSSGFCRTQTVPGTFDAWNMDGAKKTPRKKQAMWRTKRRPVIISKVGLAHDCREVLNAGFILAMSQLFNVYSFIPARIKQHH